MKKCIDSHCTAFQAAIEVLSKPWNALILNVLQPGPLRFNELSEKADGPADKVLSGRLKDLEAKGLVERQVEPGPPVKCTYALTAQGRAFGEVALSLERWGRALLKIETRPTR